MRRVLGPLAAACFLFAAAGQSSAATSHCLASDYAMQCAKIPTANPTARTAVATVAGPGATLGPSAKARLAPVYRYGVDFGWSSVSASTASRVGARFGASYLSIDYSKNWTAANLRSYHANGLATVAVWEGASCYWHEYRVDKMTSDDLFTLFTELASVSGIDQRIHLYDPKQQQTLHEICTLLDGYPLGAELIFGTAQLIDGKV